MDFMRFCIDLGAQWQSGAPMSRLTTFAIGGPANVVTLPAVDLSCPQDSAAAKVMAEAYVRGQQVRVLGRGSNLLVADAGVPDTVLRLSPESEPVVTREGLVLCGGGVSLASLCVFAEKQGLSGLEFAYGIPASVGGALYMNAGAYGGEMKDVTVYVEVLTKEGAYRRVEGEALEYEYRHSTFMENDWTGCLIIGGAFRLRADRREKIVLRMKQYMAARREKQPLEHPSAGSAFKRPPGAFAAALIDRCGLKGLRRGDAQVSEKHAGFIVNRGNAAAGDVLALMEQVRETVQKKTGVVLTPEIRVWM